MYYVRNLKEVKWRGRKEWSMHSFEDLHTTDCELSVWSISQNSENEIKETSLAITMTKDGFYNIWLCLIPTKLLKCLRFHIRRSDGETKYERMKRRHVNIIIPKINNLRLLYLFLYKNWEKSYNSPFIKFISKTKVEQYFVEKVNNGEMDQFIEDAILHKNEKAYKKYYKSLMKIPYAKAKEANINANNNNNK